MSKNNDIHNYADIINMPRHVSKKHPQMARQDRAAQFAPFVALTGHKEAIQETGRVVMQKKVLDENQKERVDAKLQRILLQIKEHPKVEIIYFVSDDRKKGGRYETIKAQVKKIDEYDNLITFINGVRINVADIYDIHL